MSNDIETAPDIYASDNGALDRLNALVSDAKRGQIKNDTSSDVRWKAGKLQVKAVDDEAGTFTAYASVYNILDSDDEVVLPGCFDRSLQHNPHPVVLWQHDIRTPVGFHITEDIPDADTKYGLPVKAELMTDCQAGQYAYAFAKKAQKVGGKAGISVGFRIIKDRWIKGSELPKSSGADPNKTYRAFVEAQLLEYSVVTFPANAEAFVTAVKSQFDSATPEPANEDDMLIDALNGEQDDAHIANVVRAKGKKLTASVDGVEHGAEDFAYVPDPEKPSTWKFPIFDAKHARLAWDLFSKADIPEADKPKVLKRIKAACKKFGVEINDGDGKGTNPVEQTKMMTTADTTSSPDYATNLAGKKRQRQIQASKWDAEDALYDTLSAIHGSNMSDEEKKSAIKDTYHKHADVMGDLHCAAMFPAEGEKAADFLAVLKSRELVEITGTVGGTEDAPLAITKGKGGKLSAASKAALMQVLANHQKATNTHAAVIKDMFGDDSTATVDGGGAGTEMGAMGQENPVPENKGADKSGEEKSGEDTPNPQNTQPVEVSDSDLHSFISGLRSETKSRLEVARD